MERNKQKVFSTFVYPMIGLCSLSVFAHSLWTTGWSSPENFQKAMIICCTIAISLFGGYFLAAYIINRLSVGMFSLEDDIPLIRQFCGYALVVTFLIKIVIGFLPEIERIGGWMVGFYTIYVVWEGVPVLIAVKEKDRLLFTILTSVVLVACPIFIQLIFNKLMFLFY